MINENAIEEGAAAAAPALQSKEATEDDGTRKSAMGAGATTPAMKEKRSWFYSLTRRKKCQAQTHNFDAFPPTNEETHLQNNNNDPIQRRVDETDAAASGTISRRKNERNVFQVFRKKMGLRFQSMRPGRQAAGSVSGADGTTDATAEFQTHSPKRELPLALQPEEIVPFTHDYERFIAKKWLERPPGPNRVMYRACCDMLSQVWYWGDISRCDAQKQLTDKPTGSFLVRDSETSGCQFTLSFRIVNVTLHYRLEYRDNYWHFEELQYESIVDMIEDILDRCTNDNFVCFVKVPNEMQPPFPVILKYPLSRYLKIPRLQDLCRRVIQRHATPEEIAKLPIPTKLQEYLSIQRELVFQS